jgi:hypothetical protein
MTVAIQNTVNNYQANGATAVFAYGFQVLQAADLVVQVDGATKALGVDYTVSGVGVQAGGNVTFLTNPANGQKVTLYRDTAINRSTDYQDSGDFLSKTVNADFDRTVMMVQELASGTKSIQNVLRVPQGESVANLPPAASRANMILAFDGSGNPYAALPVTGTAADVLTQLSNSTDLAKGVSLVGGAARVIDSIAKLRTLPKSGSPRAFVTGYYAAGDGGGGHYWYDSTDTTTADNGGTVIVAGDGGRWKLVSMGSISVKQFGAKGDWNGTTGTDDQAAINAALAAAGIGGVVYFPTTGAYRITQRLTFTAVGQTLKGAGYGGLYGTPKIVWDGAIGGHMVKVPNGMHWPTIENLFFDGNLKADLCLWVEALNGSATQNPHLSNLLFLGYRLYGLVLGELNTVTLKNGQMGNVYAENLQFRGGGLAGAYGVLVNAQNIERLSAEAWYFDPWPDPGIYFNHLTHILCVAGGLSIKGLLTTRATSYAIDVLNDSPINIDGWNAEDRFLYREAATNREPTVLSGVVGRNDVSYLAGDISIDIQGVGVHTLDGVQVQGSIRVGAVSAKSVYARGVTFALGGGWIFNGPRNNRGAIHDDVTGIMQLFGTGSGLQARDNTGGLIAELSRRFQVSWSNLPVGATPDASGISLAQTVNAGVTSITSFQNLQFGQIIVLIGADGGKTTITNTASIKLAGGVNFNLGDNDTIVLIGNNSGLACELCRSNN